MQNTATSQRNMVALMTTSLIGVTIFLGVWLYQSYKQEKHSLRRDVDHVMIMAARAMESDLIHRVDSMKPPYSLTRRFINRDSISFKEIGFGDGASPWTTDSKKRRIKHMESRQAMRESKSYPGVAGFYIGMSEILSGKHDNDIGKGIEHLLSNAFEDFVGDKDLPRKTRIVFLERDSALNVDGISSRPYKDMTVNVSAQILTEDFDWYIFKALLPKLIMALLLLLVTAYTFYLLYKNLKKERILADARKELIANITHELNTPITSAGLALESLQTRQMSDENKKEYIALASGEINRLSSLVKKIMTGIGGMKTQTSRFEEINVNDLIENVLSNMKLNIEEMQGHVNYQNVHKDITVKADPLELSGVIQNLIDNSLKYSQPEPEIDVSLTQSNREVIITVSDNGMGIPKNLRTQVFEPFYRVPTGNIHDVKGHGLGLNFVKKVVDAHEGNISIADGEAGGTRITITLAAINP